MPDTITLGLLIKTAVAGAGYGVFAELGGAIERLKAKTEEARVTQAKLGDAIESLREQGRPVDHAHAAYERMGAAIAEAERRAIGLSQAMARQAEHGQRLRSLWSEALGITGAAMTLAAPIRQAMDFESAMADVRKVVDGTDADIAALGATIQGMSREIPLAATELAAMAAAAGQLGVRLGDIPAFIQTTAKMAVAFDMPAEEAGDAMAKLANVYSIPIGEIGRLGDAINQISNESPARASEIVRALSRVGGVSKAFGLTARDAAALASAFIAMGKPPEVAGTAINAMLTKLATAPKQNKKFQEGLAALGLSAAQLKDNIDRDASGALDDFLARLSKVPKEQRMAVLVDLFGLEYADDIAALAGSLDVYRAQQAAASRAEGSMGREFAARAATTANNLQLLRNNIAELGVSLGSALLPALNGVLSSLRPMIEAFADFARANPGLVAAIGKAAAALLAFKAGSLVARAAFHLVAGSAWGLLGRLRALGAAWATLRLAMATRSVMPLLTGLQAAVPAVGGFIAKAKAAASVVGGALKAALLAAGKAALWLGRAIMLTPIGLALTAIAGAAYLVWRNWDEVAPKLAAAWQAIEDVFTDAWAWIMELPGRMLETGREIVGGLIQGLSDRTAAVVLAAKNITTAVWDKLDALPGRMLETGREIVGGLIQGLSDRTAAVVLAAKNITTAVWDKLDNLPGRMLALGREVVDGLIQGIKAKLADSGKAIEALGETIKGKFKSWLGIRSPSRVFADFGQMIGLGAAQGIASMGGVVARASAGLALAASSAFSPQLAAAVPAFDATRAELAQAAAAASARGHAAAPMQITFAPVIHITAAGDKASMASQVQEGVRTSFAEFERLMRRYEAERRRVSPMGGML